MGKTTLIDQLAKTFAVVPEPARQLLNERAEMASDPSHFVEALVERSIDNYQSAPTSEVAVFDRGLPDCVAYAAIYGLDTSDLMRTAAEYPYLNPVFIAPPWPEIYENDKLRRATFEQSAAFSEHVVEAYEGLGTTWWRCQWHNLTPVRRLSCQQSVSP